LTNKKNQIPQRTAPAPSRPPVAEKVKSSRFEWERDQVGESGKLPGTMQARMRRWLQLAQQFFTQNRDWDGDDDPTPSAA
jgi:hypothetical protein